MPQAPAHAPYTLHGRIAVILIDHAPVNALSAATRGALFDALRQAGDDPAVAGIVLAGQGRCFSAGADIAEFAQGTALSAERDPTELTALIEALDKPVVAALHGLALGGGLELALGCHARVAAPGTQLGLPEVTLGVLPGAGGTQRLPRLVGLEAAARLMLGGAPVDAEAAQALGLVDAVREPVRDAAIAWAERLVAEQAVADPSPLRCTGALPAPQIADAAAFFARLRQQAQRPRARARAAGEVVACLEMATRAPFADGLAFERARFLACNASPEARALQHGFFAQREAGRLAGLPADTPRRRIDRIGLVGGGTMGRGIAMAFADAGWPVALVEAGAERAEATRQALRAEYERLQRSGRLQAAQVAERLARIAVDSGDLALADCDLVIEAVFEDLAIKQAVCARLGAVCRPGAILASNTSTLDIDVLARSSGRPGDFVGLHFFSPAQVMKLLEVVRGAETRPDVLASVLAMARRLGKQAVVSGVGWGFIGNRMLEPYLREAEALLLQGATPRQIDQALEAFGMAMGPCRMLDLAGIDIASKVVTERGKQGGLPDDPHYRVVCRELHRIGRDGQKCGEGFYRYQGREALDDDDAVSLIAALARRLGVAPRHDIGAEEIVERCLLPLMNEGHRVLEEGIASRASDVDLVWLWGYGFPAERGGPMFEAQARGGAPWLRQRLAHYAATQGNDHGYWTAAASLNA